MPALAMQAFVAGSRAEPVQADMTVGKLVVYILIVAVSYTVLQTLIAAAKAHEVGIDGSVASAVVAPLSS